MASKLVAPRIIIKLLVLISGLKSILSAHGSQQMYKKVAVINDLPTDVDLEKYLRVLEKAMFFLSIRKHYVDIHLSFGLFLGSVNIRSIMKYRLPIPLQTRFRHLLLSFEDALEYFYKTVLNHKKEHRKVLLPILSLYMNETSWIHNLQAFSTDLLNITKYYFRKDLEELYSKWSVYEENISNRRVGPNPRDEEDCFNMLAQNPVNVNRKQVLCYIPFPCSKFIQSGATYGYDMKNRLLMVITAKFSRGCTFGFAKDNKELINEFCATIYNEAEYIAYHDFQEASLIMEQIALCSLAGHAQFLRESWVDELIDFQTAVGCFDMNRPETDNTLVKALGEEMEDWQFMHTKPSIWGGTCYTHITASSIAVFAAVVRYLVETYYTI